MSRMCNGLSSTEHHFPFPAAFALSSSIIRFCWPSLRVGQTQNVHLGSPWSLFTTNVIFQLLPKTIHTNEDHFYGKKGRFKNKFKLFYVIRKSVIGSNIRIEVDTLKTRLDHILKPSRRFGFSSRTPWSREDFQIRSKVS